MSYMSYTMSYYILFTFIYKTICKCSTNIIKNICNCSLVVPFRSIPGTKFFLTFYFWGVSPWRWSLRSWRPTLGGCSRRCCSRFVALLQTSLETFASRGQWHYGWRTGFVDGLVGKKSWILGTFLTVKDTRCWQGFGSIFQVCLHCLLYYIFCSGGCYCILCLNWYCLFHNTCILYYFVTACSWLRGYVFYVCVCLFVFV